MVVSPPPGAARGNPAPDARFACGTLRYTQAGLFVLFSWLLWGDFCFSLMENIWPNLLPLMLKGEGASNVTMALIVTTIPSVMNFVLNPIISTASDRHRGPRGRRIPFLLAATPLVTAFLVALGFSREIGAWLHAALGTLAPAWNEAACTIGVIGVLIVGFRFFELFINTVFWYLFNDVVPVAFMGRFLGLFRIAGSLAGAAFNFFLLRYAETHAAMIFLGVALLYGTMFFLMCLNVKEGAYPPPEPMAAGRRSPAAYAAAFFRECFAHRVYRLVFTYNAFSYAGNAINVFAILMAFSIGLSLDEVGKVAGTAALASVLLMYPMGALVDRLNPIRMMLLAQIGCALALAVKLVFLFFHFSHSAAFWIYAAAAGVAIPMSVANTMAGLPMLMRIFPRERFGQFCAANAMCGAVGTMAGGALSGLLLDAAKSLFGAGDGNYRLVPAWSVAFALLAAFMTYLLWREWQRLGGEKSYRPPR